MTSVFEEPFTNVRTTLEFLLELCEMDLREKVARVREVGLSIEDAIFYGLFTEAEESLLFQLEDREYLTTGIIRLLG